MPTRRKILCQGLAAASGVALLGPISSSGQAPQPGTPKALDEMTLNTRQQNEHYQPPDFGPLPATVPKETATLAGVNSLKAHAQQSGLTAGCAVYMHAFSVDTALQQIVTEQFAMLVPENELKWMALRPAPGPEVKPEEAGFDFTDADALFRFAAQNALQVRGHTLAWHNSVPEWLLKAAATVDVRRLLVEHIHTVMGRYKGRVHSWDVVNEAILPKDREPGGLRKSFWYERAGHDYIDLAYRTAREADPHAKLTYNDYGVEYDDAESEARRAAILALVRGMKQRGVPLDAVGIQSHLKAAGTATIGKGLAAYIAAIEALGLEVYLTEMDVNEDDIQAGDTATRDRIIAETYGHFLDVALANPAVKLVLTWGVSSRHTWLNDGPTHHRKQPDRPQRSLPFDPAYRPTPAFFAMRSSFDKRG